MRRPLMLAVLLAVLAVLAAGCGGRAEQESARDADQITALATPAPVADAVDPAAFDFTAQAVGGGQVDGGELAGKDLALWFWAPW